MLFSSRAQNPRDYRKMKIKNPGKEGQSENKIRYQEQLYRNKRLQGTWR